MSHTEIQQRIVAFARHLTEDRDDATAIAIAQERDWLDIAGVPTREGHALVEELISQNGTRTAFRAVS